MGKTVLDLFNDTRYEAASQGFLKLPSIRANLIEDEEEAILTYLEAGQPIILPPDRVKAILEEVTKLYQLNLVVLK